jgi:hypothetical protein
MKSKLVFFRGVIIVDNGKIVVSRFFISRPLAKPGLDGRRVRKENPRISMPGASRNPLKIFEKIKR